MRRELTRYVWENGNGHCALDAYLKDGFKYYCAEVLSLSHTKPRTRVILKRLDKKLVWLTVFTDDHGRYSLEQAKYVSVSEAGDVTYLEGTPEENGYEVWVDGLVESIPFNVTIEFGPMGVVDKSRLMQTLFPNGEYRSIRVVKLDDGTYMCQCDVTDTTFDELCDILEGVEGSRIYPTALTSIAVKYGSYPVSKYRVQRNEEGSLK